jgi:hypothetical protein
VAQARSSARALLGQPEPTRGLVDDAELSELLMLAGTYRTVSHLVNGLRLPLEPGARRFSA